MEILFIVLMVFVSFVESESVHMNGVKAKGQLPFFSKLMTLICYVLSLWLPHCEFHYVVVILYYIFTYLYFESIYLQLSIYCFASFVEIYGEHTAFIWRCYHNMQ